MSTTTNIGLFKHDNPATNTDEFNVDKALNENWDKLDTAIGTDRERLTKLESDNTANKTDISDINAKNTEQDKYIAELEAENTRLKEDLKGLPSGQAEGESIDLNDSAEMRCDLKISGNSKQDGEPTPDTPVEVECCGDNGCINEVICNKKNIFNKNDSIQQGYVFDGNGNLSVNNGAYFAQITYIKVKPNTTYTISASKYNDYFRVCEYTRDKTYIQRILGTGDTKYYTFTTTPTTEYIRVSCNINNLDSIQIEESATEQIEHKEQVYTIPTQQPMRAIGDIRDTFIKKNNKWYERHYITRKIFNGTENWVMQETWSAVGTNTNAFYYTHGLNLKRTDNNLCSHFKYEKSISVTDIESFSCTTNFIIRIAKSKATNSSEFKVWLTSQYEAGTPVYVDYILETPLDIECTEEQSTILDQIEKEAKTYKNVTHMYSTDQISSYKEVTYKKDIDTMITNIEQAILSQGGNI